jgi:hypothetical protein
MTEFKKKVQSIIEDYCEGINHLEFSIDNFPEMLDRIETEALRIHDVVGRSEQLVCSCSRAKGIDHDEDGKAYCIDCGKYLEQTIP